MWRRRFSDQTACPTRGNSSRSLAWGPSTGAVLKTFLNFPGPNSRFSASSFGKFRILLGRFPAQHRLTLCGDRVPRLIVSSRLHPSARVFCAMPNARRMPLFESCPGSNCPFSPTDSRPLRASPCLVRCRSAHVLVIWQSQSHRSWIGSFFTDRSASALTPKSREVAIFTLQAAKDRELPGFFATRRVSEGRMREHVASDVTPSLAYASGWD